MKLYHLLRDLFKTYTATIRVPRFNKALYTGANLYPIQIDINSFKAKYNPQIDTITKINAITVITFLIASSNLISKREHLL